MSPSDHLIERAAALLQSKAKLALPQDAPRLPLIPEAEARLRPAMEEDAPPPEVSHMFVPLPGGRPALVMPPPEAPVRPVAFNGGPAALADPEPAPSAPPDQATRPGTPLRNADPIGYDRLQAAGMVLARGGRSRISEEYRIVLARVLRALREEPDGPGAHNLLLVTSAKPGEGKTFTALNLAGSIAQHTTEKVLLVDLDAKVRPLTALMGASGEPGFYELAGDPNAAPETVMLPTAIPNLSFMPVGHRMDDMDGQAGAQPITSAIVRIARQFPNWIVVLDAPPCLSTSDPSTVAPVVGQIVMVIEAERTQRSEVEAALDLIRVCPTITMLLNKVQLTSSHTFGAYDYYGNYS